MAEIREVRVEVRKTVSDGSYGNETASVAFTATVGEDVSFTAGASLALQLTGLAHDTVLSRLRGSTNEQIRMALETPEEREARQTRERAEREAERERWRLQAERERAESEKAWAAARDEDDTAEDEQAEDDGDGPW
jgi:hypothetical protein